jgi:hypothetical protein
MEKIFLEIISGTITAKAFKDSFTTTALKR